MPCFGHPMLIHCHMCCSFVTDFANPHRRFRAAEIGPARVGVTRTFCSRKHPKAQYLTGKARRGTLIPVVGHSSLRAENDGLIRAVALPLHAPDSAPRFKHLSSTVHKCVSCPRC